MSVTFRHISNDRNPEAERNLAELSITSVYCNGTSVEFEVPSFFLHGNAYVAPAGTVNIIFDSASPRDPLGAIADAVFTLLTTRYRKVLDRAYRLQHATEHDRIREAANSAVREYQKIHRARRAK